MLAAKARTMTDRMAHAAYSTLAHYGNLTDGVGQCLPYLEDLQKVNFEIACKVAAQDVEGNRFEASYKGFTSRIVQHEYDHLEGILLVDRMSPADKLTNRNALDQLISRYKANQAPAS